MIANHRLCSHLSASALATLIVLSSRPAVAEGQRDAHAAAMGAGHVAGHAPGPPARLVKLTGPTSTPMEVRGGHPTIRAMVGGKGPYLFIVDTGAGHCVVDASLAKELGLESLGEIRMGDPMNPHAIKANRVLLPSLQVGDATFEGVGAASWDQSKMFGGADPPRGVIGLPVFQDVLVTFDYVDKKLELAPGSLPPVDGKSIVPFTTPDGIPQFDIKVGGVHMAAHLDTGSGGFFSLPKGLRDSVRFDGPLVEVGRGRTVNSEFAILGGKLDGALELAGFSFERPFIETTDVLPMPNVGSKALAPFAVTFDQRAQTMRWTAKAPLVSPTPPASNASAAGAPPSPPPTGLRFAVAGGEGMMVYDIAPGSPGAQAGITAGEEVLKINGKDIAQYDDDSRRAAMRTSPVTLTLRKDGKAREVTIRF